jgi:hypothetical protein
VVQAPGTVSSTPTDAPTERKVRPFADVRGMFESGTPEGGLELGGGIEVPWFRIGVYVRVLRVFEIIPRVGLVVPIPIPMPGSQDAKSIYSPHLSAYIEAEVPMAIDQGFGVGLGGAVGAEWGPWKWAGLYAQLGGRYFFTVYNSCCTVQGRFTASGGLRLRLP